MLIFPEEVPHSFDSPGGIHTIPALLGGNTTYRNMASLHKIGSPNTDSRN